jgi:hypothetical protein
MNAPKALALTADGGLLVADASNNRIRFIAPTARQLLKALRLTPAPPKAGKQLEAKAQVSLEHAGALLAGDITCTARIGRQLLATLRRSVSGDVATCVWKVPAGAAGKSIRARSP